MLTDWSELVLVAEPQGMVVPQTALSVRILIALTFLKLTFRYQIISREGELYENRILVAAFGIRGN